MTNDKDKKIGMINRPEEKIDMVSIPKLSISNVKYDMAGWNDTAYWKGHYNSIVQQLRETINSQAEIIAELSTTKSNMIRQVEELRNLLDDLKQSIGLDDTVPAKYIADVVKEKDRKVVQPVAHSSTGWAMYSAGDMRMLAEDEVALQQEIRKDKKDA